jgi:hypothetical protein
METKKIDPDIDARLAEIDARVVLNKNRIRIVRELILSFGKSNYASYKYDAFIDQILYDCLTYKLSLGDSIIFEPLALLHDIRELEKAVADPSYECAYLSLPDLT